MANHLYYGDNLQVLRESIRDESVDLIYLDPPFNSNATYNVLFRGPSGDQSQAQIEAFEDTWHWNNTAERAVDEVMQGPNADVAEMLRSMRSFLKDNDMMAYLTHMAVRLVELHRVLKPTGSIYLHCDPTASHYLKVLMDAVFGNNNYRTELVWLRSRNPKGSQHDLTHYGPQTDSILFYSKTAAGMFNPGRIRKQLTKEQLLEKYPLIDEIGRYADGPILRSGSMGPRPNLVYTYKGFTPGPAGWRMEPEKLAALDAKGNLVWTSTGAPRRKLRPEDDQGDPIGSLWDDIPPVNSQAQERLGYPTQKPVALLERILSASSNPGDVVLDPFCGCGTTVHAAEKLGRQWIGIDITHLSISLIEKRLKDAFPGIAFTVHGAPKDLDGARDLSNRDKYQFQWWAVSLVDAVPFGGKKKGADGGIDGHIFFRSGAKTVEKAIVSVKGGGVGVKDIRELIAVVDRERAKIGVYISLEPHTEPMKKEAAGAGLYDGPTGKVPKLQLFTIEELFAGKKPQIPLMERGFKAAAREQRNDQSEFDI